MSKPTTPLDSELAKIFGNNTRIFRAMRELFKQAGDLSPAAIEEALITGGNAGTAANQALSVIERLAQAIELIALMPHSVDRVENDNLIPVQDFAISDTLADLSPSFHANQDALIQEDIGDTVQAFSADLDTYAANPLTANELGELQNIDTVTITNPQWAFLGNFNQNLRTTDNVTFAKITMTGDLIMTQTGDGLVAQFRQIGGSGANLGMFFFIDDTAKELVIDFSGSSTAGLDVKFKFGATTWLTRNASGLFLEDITTINDTTDATSTTTGSGQFKGGIGVGKNIIGGSIVKPGAFTTGARPIPRGAGSMVFDTTLGIPIWHDGTNWIDATGTTV